MTKSKKAPTTPLKLSADCVFTIQVALYRIITQETPRRHHEYK